MGTPLEETVDLYGFPIRVTALQKAEREACDASAAATQVVWGEYIEKDRLPSSESKLKDMIRKVSCETMKSCECEITCGVVYRAWPLHVVHGFG